MRNNTSKIAAAVGAGLLALATQSAFATFINGGISFGTTSLTPFTVNDNVGHTLVNATSMTVNDTGIFVGSASGTYAPTSLFGLLSPGLISVNGFSWAGYGAAPAADVLSLWSFTDTVNSDTYSFTSSTLTAVYSPGSDQWTFGGAGVANVTGFGPTLGTWAMQIGEGVSGSEVAFSWDSTATASGQNAPDGGPTVALLGGTFIGLGMLRRKLSRGHQGDKKFAPKP